MKRFKRVSHDGAASEKKIITGLIINDRFCSQVLPVLKHEHFKLAYALPVFRWVKEYFEKYDEAPGRNIQSIFDEEKHKFDKETRQSIENLLVKISNEHSVTAFNTQYEIDLAKKYLTKRSYEFRAEETLRLLKADRLDDIDDLYRSDVVIEAGLSKAYNPFDPQKIRERYLEEKSTKVLTNFSGNLGKLVKGFERNNLVAIQGPEKRGKTWWLQQIAFESLYRGLKVAWFSFEMNEDQTTTRIDQMVTGLPDEFKNKVMIPVFDCKRNQEGSCNDKARENNINNVLVGLDDKELPDYEDYPEYIPCTACRGKSGYESAVWCLVEYNINPVTEKDVLKKVKWLKFKNNLMIKNYPAYKAGWKEVKNDLKEFKLQGFEPDVLVIDYLDIMERDERLTERESIFKNWRFAKSLTAELNIVMITADQADAQARKQSSLKQTNFTDDKRKDSVLDIKIGLNQTEDEKEQGIMRVNVLYNRMNAAVTTKEVMVAQCLDLGQCYLDSEFI